MTEWWEELFDERYFTFYESLASSTDAQEDAGFIEKALDLAPGSSVLDLGCGHGRHSVALALRGHEVTGLDYSASLLERAGTLARDRSARVTWIRRDMRDLSDLGPFDACISLCTAFGYFNDDEDARVISSLRSILRPRGRLLLDLDNPFPILRRLPFDVWSESPSQVTRESMALDPLTSRRLTMRARFPASGGKESMPASSVRLYYPHEVRSLLESSGFVVDGIFGLLRDEPYEWRRSQRMVWTATRRS